MESSKLCLFVRFIVTLADDGYFNLENEDLICLAEECLALSQYLNYIIFIYVIYKWLGELYQAVNRITEALECYKKQLKVAIQIGNQKLEGMAYRNLGSVCSRLRKYREAMKYYEKHISIARQIGDNSSEGTVHVIMGDLHHSLGNFQEALKHYENGLNIAIELGAKELEMNAYYGLGNTYYSFGKYNKAIEHYKKQLQKAVEIESIKGQGLAYHRLGSAYQLIGKYKEAFDYHEKHLKIATKLKNKINEATANNNLGNACHDLGKYPEAITFYKRCLEIAIEMEHMECEITAYYGLGNTYFSLGKYNEAIKHHEKQLKMAVENGDKKNEEKAYSGLGIAYQSLGKCTEAFAYHEKHLNIALKIGDKDGEGTSYANLGATYLLEKRYQEAIKYLEKSLKIAMETGNKNTEGSAYLNMGLAYDSLGRNLDAYEWFKKTLNLATETGNKNLEKSACLSFGMTNAELGKYHEAIKHQERSLKIAIETGDKFVESRAYGNLGVVHNLQGKFYDAILYYECALKISKETGNKSSEAKSYVNLGDTYQTLGKFNEAMKYIEKLLEIAIETKDKNAQGMAHGHFGRLYHSSGRFQEAIDSFKKQLEIALEMDNKKYEGYAYANLGNSYFTLGKLRDSIEWLEKSLRIATEIGDKWSEGMVCSSLGNVYSSLDEYHKAIEMYEKSINTARDIGDKRGEANAYSNLGMSTLLLARSYNDKHDQENYHLHMKESESYFKEGVQCYEWIFDHLQEQDSLKISIVDTFIYAYRGLTDVLIEREQIEEALLVSERGRARALRDLLILKYDLAQTYTSKGDDDPKVKGAQLESFLPKRHFCILFFTLQSSKVGYWVLTHQGLFFHTSEIRGVKITKDMTLDGQDKKGEMEMYLTQVVHKAYDKMKFREGVTCEDRSFRSFNVVSGQVSSDHEQLLPKENEEMKDNEKSDNSATYTRCIPDEDLYDPDDVTNPLETLFDRLIAPAVHNITEDEVVIIPDGPLNMIPFAALTDPNTGLFWFETKRIRLAPSLAALKALQECPGDHHSQKGALIVGGPDIGEVMFRGDKRSFCSLPFAKYEAEKISAVLGVTPLIGSQATKEAVIERLREGLAVIHFAAHGSENGEILLAPPVSSASKSTPKEQDYILTVKEVQGTGIRAQLVVLSCCHSGRGEIKAEGVVGMSRAFLAAGARAVVASLWAIDDEATKVFMLNFYSHLKKGETASASLQQATKDMRKTERYRKPKYWASFFLIGDDVKICL